MACPYFEPQCAASPATHANARLPLIAEYDGICHATSEPFAPESSHRFQYCNQGNVQGVCQHFPAGDVDTSLRYQVTSQDQLHLSVLIVRERRHWPHSWHSVDFHTSTARLEPAIADVVLQAQLLAFCSSYLQRFPHSNETG